MRQAVAIAVYGGLMVAQMLGAALIMVGAVLVGFSEGAGVLIIGWIAQMGGND